MRFSENIQKTKCAKCNGLESCETQGYIKFYKELNGKMYEVYQKCAKREKFETELRYQRTLRSSGLPKEYYDKTFDNYDATNNTDAVNKIKQYLLEKAWQEGKGLILIGPTGTGKTHLVAAILQYLAKHDVYVLFVFVPDFLDELREMYREDYSDDVEEEDKFELVKTVRVLILDDLGTERITDWTREKITQLINYRYSNALPIIATTNLSPSELKVRLGERAYSRLIGMSEIIPIVGEDWRLKHVSKRGN